MITPTRLSYGVLAATIILACLLHLGVPLLVVLFSYFALRQLYFLTKRKWLALILFGVVVAGIAAAAVFLTRLAVLALPNVADTSIPSASAWAQKRQIELPFTDFESLRQVVIDALGQEANYLRNVANFARSTTALLVFGVLEIVDWRSGVSGGDSQARVFAKQQNHRRPDSEPGVADLDRADHRRAAHGHPRLDPCAGRTELSARGNADC